MMSFKELLSWPGGNEIEEKKNWHPVGRMLTMQQHTRSLTLDKNQNAEFFLPSL